MPPDMESILISRTIGQDRIVEGSVFRFTHSLVMDWFLPGVPPTGKRKVFNDSTGVRLGDTE
jgi:carboxymethylenebutenolidase